MTSSSSSKIQRRPQAFTLVELLMVLIVMSVLAGAVVVSLAGRGREHELKAAANGVANALRLARDQSYSTGTPHSLVWADAGRKYRVEVQSRGADRAFEPVVGVAGRFRTLPEGVAAVSLRPDDQDTEPIPDVMSFEGEQSYAGRVGLVNRAGSLVVVEVLPKTGQIRVHEP